VAIDQMRIRSDGSVVVAWLARSGGPQAGLLLRLTVLDSSGKIIGEKRFEDILSVFAPDSLCPLPSDFARFPSAKAVDIAVTGNQTALLAFTCGGHTLHLLDENLNPLWAQEITPPGLMEPTNLVGFGALSGLHGQALLGATDDGKIVLGASVDGLALEAFSDAYSVPLSLGGSSDVLVAQFDTWGRIVAANTLGLKRETSISKLLVSSDSVLVMGSTGAPNQTVGSGPSLADMDLHLTSLSLGNLLPRWQRVMDIRNEDRLIDAALTPEGNLIIGAATGSITRPRGEVVMPSRTLLLALDGQGNELARKLLQGQEQGTLLSMVVATATTGAGKGALTISGFRMRPLPEDPLVGLRNNDSTGFVNTLPLSELGL
jgi:hypothetical protein